MEGLPHPINCIIPPHLAERILENGSPAQKKKAEAYIRVAGQLRGQRPQLSELSSRARAAVNGERTRGVYDDPVLGRDPQPGHMKDYVETTSDKGGVHINSGIPNKAFYEVALALGGYAWEKAGLIWYKTLCEEQHGTAGRKQLARRI